MTTSETFTDGLPTEESDLPTRENDMSTEESDFTTKENDRPTEGDDLTTEEFESALANLLRIADRSDVATPRSVDVTSRSENAEWMVEITRIDRHH